MTKYDVAVVGAGPGGYVAAIRAAQLGAKTAVIEAEVLGGVCLNWGCIPTKTLVACADALSTVRNAARFGVHIRGEVDYDWPAMLARKNEVVKGLNQGVGSLLKSNGVDVLFGTATFKTRTRLCVSGRDGTSNLEAAHVILATGSEAIRPGFVPKARNVLLSRAALDLAELPGSLIVLGGGVIGCEFACLYAQLGIQVTLVEMLPEILPLQDRDVSAVVRRKMEQQGIQVRAGARLEDIRSNGRSVSARVGDDKLKADAMLVCVGRRPVTDGLKLKAAGLAVDESGALPVDEHCRTRAAGIYAIGDVTGGIQLAHRASAMGICAANNAMGQTDRHSDKLVPSCIFTTPEIASVGLTQAAAKEAEVPVRVGTFPFAALGKARAIQETTGFCKILADKETDQVLGVHIVGPHATDLIAEAAAAMHLETTAAELGQTIHAHPTLSEVVMEAAHAVHDQCVHLPRKRSRS